MSIINKKRSLDLIVSYIDSYYSKRTIENLSKEDVRNFHKEEVDRQKAEGLDTDCFGNLIFVDYDNNKIIFEDEIKESYELELSRASMDKYRKNLHFLQQTYSLPDFALDDYLKKSLSEEDYKLWCIIDDDEKANYCSKSFEKYNPINLSI